MIELEVDGVKIMTLNDDNKIVINDKNRLELNEDVVNSDSTPSFVVIED